MEQLMNDSQIQILTERTWDLYGRINDRIQQHGFSFCSHCSNHGRNSVVEENSVQERETMIGIKSSLRDVHNNLVYLQCVRSWQKGPRDEALSRLEESRMLLIERIDQCSENVRKLDVLKELVAFLGDGKTNAFVMKSKGGEKRLNGISSFLVSTSRFALEFAVMFVSIYSTVKLYEHRQGNERWLKREIGAAPVDTTATRRKVEFLVTDSNMQLNVLSGRG